MVSRETDRTRLRRAHRRGEVRRLRAGGYLVLDDGADGPAYRSDEIARIMSVHRQLEAPHVFSHVSAAALWGLARWTASAKVHVIQRYRASGRAAGDVARHYAGVNALDVVERQGLPVTGLARTIVDCALSLHPLEALVIADAALATGLAREDVIEHLAARPGARGARKARLVLDLADRGADSPWETWLRYVALRAGLPRPATQHAVETRLGTFYVDVAWPDHGVLAEFDGRVKYRDGAFRPGYDADDARFREKRRADAIEEATGHRLLRFTASDSPDGTADRLRSRFGGEAARSFRLNPLLPPVPRAR